jgi:cysteine desulfurase/selenocysteine lyase
MQARSVGEVRADFPILSRSVRGKPLAYLDNAATSQKPRSVIEASARFYEGSNANVHRGLHTLGEEATAIYEGAREKVRGFIGAVRSSEVIFTRGTTESINLVADSWGSVNLGPGDLILLSGMEHHSDIVPWQLLCERRGCKLRYIPLESDGGIDLRRLESEWDYAVRLVCATQVSNVLGTVNDVRALGRMAHERGARILVDGAQSVPHMGVNVVDLDCDFFAFSGHKAYAPMGIGVLYAKEAILEAMPPWMGGGDMILSVGDESSTWNELPWKFEAGTPNVGGAAGLAAAIDYIRSLGFEWIESREALLASAALERLERVPGLALYGRAKERAAVFSFNLGRVHAHDLAQYLDKEGIAIRAGHHCAQPLMRRLGIGSAARASLTFYNTVEELDRLAAALEAASRFYA